MGGGGEAEADDAAGDGAAVLVFGLGVAAGAAADAAEAGAVEAPHAVKAEMDAEPEVLLEAEEHLLAVGFGAFEATAVERIGAVGEAALGRAGGEAVADEVFGEGVGETVDGVTFGQDAVLCGAAQRWGAALARKREVGADYIGAAVRRVRRPCRRSGWRARPAGPAADRAMSVRLGRRDQN